MVGRWPPFVLLLWALQKLGIDPSSRIKLDNTGEVVSIKNICNAPGITLAAKSVLNNYVFFSHLSVL